jgi:hypothetical protein
MNMSIRIRSRFLRPLKFESRDQLPALGHGRSLGAIGASSGIDRLLGIEMAGTEAGAVSAARVLLLTLMKRRLKVGRK